MLLEDLRDMLHDPDGFACTCLLLPPHAAAYSVRVLLRLSLGGRHADPSSLVFGWAENNEMPRRASAAYALLLAEDAPQDMNERCNFVLDNGIQQYRVDGAQPLMDVDEIGKTFIAAWRLALRGTQRGGR